MAKCLGYYLQAKQLTKFTEKNHQGYQALTEGEGMKQEGKYNPDALLGNSFIRRISEGSEEREFYHKSI